MTKNRVMGDVVERLRTGITINLLGEERQETLLDDAADEIVRLRAALVQIGTDDQMPALKMRALAKEALK